MTGSDRQQDFLDYMDVKDEFDAKVAKIDEIDRFDDSYGAETSAPLENWDVDEMDEIGLQQ